jgi:hypothetical protein
MSERNTRRFSPDLCKHALPFEKKKVAVTNHSRLPMANTSGLRSSLPSAERACGARVHGSPCTASRTRGFETDAPRGRAYLISSVLISVVRGLAFPGRYSRTACVWFSVGSSRLSHRPHRTQRVGENLAPCRSSTSASRPARRVNCCAPDTQGEPELELRLERLRLTLHAQPAP